MDPEYTDEQPVMPEWNQAQALEYQKLQAAQAEADNALASGEIDDDGHRQYVQQIQPRLRQLGSIRTASEQAAQAQAKKQLMDQNAMMQSLQHQDGQFQAAGFQQRTATFSDPIRGESLHFFQPEPGKWQQMDWPDEEGELAASGEFGNSLDGKEDAGEPSPPTEPVRRSVFEDQPEPVQPWHPTGGFTMTAAQRAVEDAATGGKQIRQSLYDQAMRDADAQKNGLPRDPSLSQGQLNELWRRANAAVGGPNNIHRQDAVNHTYQALLASEQRRQQHQVDMEARAAEHRQMEAARGQRGSARGIGGAGGDSKPWTDQQILSRWDHHIKALQAEHDKWLEKVKNGEANADDAPAHLASAENMRAKAMSRIADEMGVIQQIRGGNFPKDPDNIHGQRQLLAQIMAGLMAAKAPAPQPTPTPVNPAPATVTTPRGFQP